MEKCNGFACCGTRRLSIHHDRTQLTSGADLSHLDDAGRSPLVLVVKGNFEEVASALVAGGSDPNTHCVNDDGSSHNLLFDAIMVGNEEFNLFLIEKGC
jgi:hypothetical protein